MSFDGFLGSSESQTNVLVVSDSLGGLFSEEFLVGEANSGLLLEGSFMLRRLKTEKDVDFT